MKKVSSVGMGITNSRDTIVFNWTPELLFERLMYDDIPLENELRRLPTCVRVSNVPSVRDQLNLGASTVHAVLGAYECITMRCPSRLFVFYNMRKMAEVDRASDEGVKLIHVIRSLQWNGVCEESLWPYNPEDFDTQPSDECYAQAANSPQIRAYTVEHWHMRGLLSRGLPIIAGLQMYASYESESTRNTGDHHHPSSGEKLIGGHAILIIGYDNDTKLYIFQNSRGVEWGNRGYGTLPYSVAHDPNLLTSLWTIEIDDDKVVQDNASDYEYSLANSVLSSEHAGRDQQSCDSSETSEPFSIDNLRRLRENPVLEHHAHTVEITDAHLSLSGCESDVD